MNIPKVTIAICTRNRAHKLHDTLIAIGRTIIPVGLQCELLVVDNGSIDDTQHIVESFKIQGIDIRYRKEHNVGLSHARNAALQDFKGQIILFTDDDIRPEGEWVDGMVAPILTNNADVVCGQVRIAEQLYRPWMTDSHKRFFADTSYADFESDKSIIGANFSFGRHVIAKVPEFDTNLGAGALGFGEDSLFADQLNEAGFRIATTNGNWVVHDFDENRLLRTSLLNAAERMGYSTGYVYRHWRQEFPWPYLRCALKGWPLYLQESRTHHCDKEEGCSFNLIQATRCIFVIKGYFAEMMHSPQYSRRGLRRTLPAN